MASLKSRISREERERIIKLKHRFENRITIAKFGKESMSSGDYGNALKKYVEYLSILSEIKEVKDIYSLKVSHFDTKRDLTEMLMMSHIYFEMARMYDAVPRFHEDAKKCLEQFVHFTANQPYQVVNSEMVRKFIKKTSFKNPEDFRYAYQQIYVQSKKCYVVTFCFGNQHVVTQDYRLFKDWLLDFPAGQTLVRYYYLFSSVLVPRYEHRPWARMIGRGIIRPILVLFSKTVLPVILKRC